MHHNANHHNKVATQALSNAENATLQHRGGAISGTVGLIIITLSLLIRFIGIGSNDLLAEEAYYWNYSQHLDFSYLDHPPMVALLIKLSTLIFGNNEWSVRLPSIICWMIATFFSYKLTERISRGAGLFAVMLLSVLPFYFVQSLVITPDQPLIACWSAALYCLYRAMVQNESRYWYLAGVCAGVGLLSKYTIVLLGPITLVYLCMVPEARKWLSCKEPWLSTVIALVIFTPVIWWNAQHEWASFVFQGSARFHAANHFSLHHVLGLLCLFLTPLGVYSLWRLIKNDKKETLGLTSNTRWFLLLFTLMPLAFFGYFSMSHAVKFNWIGPGLLALIPWLAMHINNNPQKMRPLWIWSAWIALFIYAGLLYSIGSGQPESVSKVLLPKFIAWDDLTKKINTLAGETEAQTHVAPTLVALDLYESASELTYYQNVLLARGEINKIYPVTGRHLFGSKSLMYKYWDKQNHLQKNLLILVARDPQFINNSKVKSMVMEKSPVQTIWSVSQGKGAAIKPVFYQIVTLSNQQNN